MDSLLMKVKSRLTKALLAAVSVSLLLLVLACGATSEPQDAGAPVETSAAADPVVEQAVVEIGQEVGNRIPDFNLALADGTTVSATSLVGKGQPAFLFFFATT